jgi:small GTP-binding protein
MSPSIGEEQPMHDSSIKNASSTKQPSSNKPSGSSTPTSTNSIINNTTISIMPINPKKKICQSIRKIIMLGESFVGKTSIVRRLSGESFLEDNQVLTATLGTDFLTRVIVHTAAESEGGHFLKLQLWDTAGEEKFGLGLVPNAYLRQSHGVFLVYDVSDRQSFEKIWKWHQTVQDLYKNQEKQRVAMVLVGNKCDVMMNRRQVSFEEGQALARTFHVPFFECSAKNGLYIEQALTCMIQAIESHTLVLQGAPLGVPQCVPHKDPLWPQSTTQCRQIPSSQLQLLPASFFLLLLCCILML